MFTGTLALLHRALRLDARLLRTHLFRVGFAALATFMSLYFLSRGWPYAGLGLTCFGAGFVAVQVRTVAGESNEVPHSGAALPLLYSRGSVRRHDAPVI